MNMFFLISQKIVWLKITAVLKINTFVWFTKLFLANISNSSKKETALRFKTVFMHSPFRWPLIKYTLDDVVYSKNFLPPKKYFQLQQNLKNFTWEMMNGTFSHIQNMSSKHIFARGIVVVQYCPKV